MELTRYSKYPGRRRGACHGLAATALVERAIKRSGGRVRLAAQKASSHSNQRLRRSVWVRQGGRWRDLSKLEMEAGLALWLPNGIENAHNREYLVLAERAAAARKGLYDPAACGAGPDQDLPISVTVNWDADGNDAQDLNGEWIDIHNGGGRDLRLGGWWVRDSWLRYGQDHVPGYRLPDATVVPAGRTLRVRVGCGAAGDLEQHWCLRESAFENVTSGFGTMGDGAYLFDPQGDLRASQTYPCVVACSDPLAGRVRLDVQPRRGRVDLDHERQRLPGRPRRPPGQAAQRRQAGPVRVRLSVPPRHRAPAGRDAADRPGRLAVGRHAPGAPRRPRPVRAGRRQGRREPAHDG